MEEATLMIALFIDSAITCGTNMMWKIIETNCFNQNTGYTTWEFIGLHQIQWDLGIRDTQGTVKNCPEF